jgi:predicted transcriptional regulator
MSIIRGISFFVICLSTGFSFSGFAQNGTAADTLDAAAILRGENAPARQQWLRRQIFVENILTQTAVDLSDSTLFFRLQQQSGLSLNRSQLSRIPPRVDDVGEHIRRDELDLPPMINLNNLLGSGIKYLAQKLGRSDAKTKPFAVIPSELEIDVLKALWRDDEATTSQIYAQLDSVQLTVVDLEQALATMTQRGLVEREQISPRHEFTLFGVADVEMSPRNRKNREYLYRPKISRQTMLTFLDATAFSYRIASLNNHLLINEHLRRLINKLAVTE